MTACTLDVRLILKGLLLVLVDGFLVQRAFMIILQFEVCGPFYQDTYLIMWYAELLMDQDFWPIRSDGHFG